MEALALREPATLAALAQRYGGQVDDACRDAVVTHLAPVEAAPPGALAPLTARRYVSAARDGAALLLVDASLADTVAPGRRWVHPHAAFALAELLAAEEPAPLVPPRAAHVDASAELAADVRVGPGAVVQAGARIGPGCVLEPNAVVYPRVHLGARVHVGAGAVLGRPGFGWVVGPEGRVRRMPHLGGVVIEDDVEIGALCTVDAGVLAPTRIGRAARLDAHVHVGHNALVGSGAFLAAQSGLAGSARVGSGAQLGGQVGVADHCTIGDGARVAAKSGVIGDVPAGATFAGYPAVERMRWLRGLAAMLRGR